MERKAIPIQQTLIIGVCVVGLVALLGLALPLTRNKDSVEVPSKRSSVSAEIPPIDTAAPDEIETATFALG